MKCQGRNEGTVERLMAAEELGELCVKWEGPWEKPKGRRRGQTERTWRRTGDAQGLKERMNEKNVTVQMY